MKIAKQIEIKHVANQSRSYIIDSYNYDHSPRKHISDLQINVKYNI